MKKFYLVVGNPGSGKSTTANTALGRLLFPSGSASDGASLTKTHEVAECPELKGYVIDAPGLADSKNRAARAAEIEKAFKQNGIYKVFFVLRPTDGRLNEQDITTMKSIVEAVPAMKYSVILTQVCPGRETESANGQIRELLELLFPQLSDVETAFHIIPEIEAARKKENVLLPTEHQNLLRTFMLNAPESKVMEVDVGTIKSSDEEFRLLQQKMAEMKANALIAVEQHKEEMKALLDEHKKLENKIGEQTVLIATTKTKTEEQTKLIEQLQTSSNQLAEQLKDARRRRRNWFQKLLGL